MRKCFTILFLLVFIILTGCVTPGPSSVTPTSDKQGPIAPLPQAIQFENVASALEFLRVQDISAYSSEKQPVYREMLEEISRTGAIPVPVYLEEGIGEMPIGSMSLTPRAKYEDIAISYRVFWNETSYAITYSIFDPSYQAALQEGIRSYYRERFGMLFAANPDTTEDITVEYENASYEALLQNLGDGKIRIIFPYNDRFIIRVTSHSTLEATREMLKNLGISYTEIPDRGGM